MLLVWYIYAIYIIMTRQEREKTIKKLMGKVNPLPLFLNCEIFKINSTINFIAKTLNFPWKDCQMFRAI